MKTVKIYGQFALQTVPQFQRADHIMGCQLEWDAQNRPDQLSIQYRCADDAQVQTLQMDFVQALFLLSCLKSLQLDSGVQFPDDPRG